MARQDLFSVAEAAELAGMSEPDLRTLLRMGVVNGDKVAGQWLLDGDGVGQAEAIAAEAELIADEEYEDDDEEDHELRVRRLEVLLNPGDEDDGYDDE